MDSVERRTSVETELVLPGTFPVARESVDAGRREELVRGGGRLGGPVEAAKPKAAAPALVLPSTYIKPTPVITKSPLNSAKPTTFASTLASPPVITGTPAYGLSSARGRDGLTEAERLKKEWQDAQKEARKAKRREETQRLREQEREAARNESRVQQVSLLDATSERLADCDADHHPATCHRSVPSRHSCPAIH